MNQKLAIWKRKIAKEKLKNQQKVWDKLTNIKPNNFINPSVSVQCIDFSVVIPHRVDLIGVGVNFKV